MTTETPSLAPGAIFAKGALAAVMLLAAVSLLSSCKKKECPICDQYGKALRKCTGPTPYVQDVGAAVKQCRGLCKKKMSLPKGDRRSRFSRQFMPYTSCVIDYENSGCKGFRACMDKLHKRPRPKAPPRRR